VANKSKTRFETIKLAHYEDSSAIMSALLGDTAQINVQPICFRISHLSTPSDHQGPDCYLVGGPGPGHGCACERGGEEGGYAKLHPRCG
jgi:hypothetical protein